MAVIGFSALVRDIENIVEGEVAEYEELIRQHMEDAYATMVAESPVLSGYYASNHSLTVRRGGSGGKIVAGEGAVLIPAEKDSEQPGVYEANINTRMSAEISNLAAYQAGDTIRIATSVPYAGAVEAMHGVYAGAAQTFDLTLTSSFDEG